MDMNERTDEDGGPDVPRGRLVLVAEKQLSQASKHALRGLLEDIVWQDDVTMVSGLSRASVLEAGDECGRIFYNYREYLSPEEAFSLMPWREIWLVAGGRVWQMGPRVEPHV